MAELTREEIKEAVKEALHEKFELTFGMSCVDSANRADMRKDMEFLRNLRTKTSAGGERIFWWVMAAVGISALSFFGLSPETIGKLSNHIK